MAPRLLADENLHARIVSWLRSMGIDVRYAAETLSGLPDELVLHRANEENRILVTDDKGFGELVVRRRLAAAGVLLLRQSAASVDARIARLAAVWPRLAPLLAGSFSVVTDLRVRVRPLRAADTDSPR